MSGSMLEGIITYLLTLFGGLALFIFVVAFFIARAILREKPSSQANETSEQAALAQAPEEARFLKEAEVEAEERCAALQPLSFSETPVWARPLSMEEMRKALCLSMFVGGAFIFLAALFGCYHLLHSFPKALAVAVCSAAVFAAYCKKIQKRPPPDHGATLETLQEQDLARRCEAILANAQYEARNRFYEARNRFAAAQARTQARNTPPAPFIAPFLTAFVATFIVIVIVLGLLR